MSLYTAFITRTAPAEMDKDGFDCGKSFHVQVEAEDMNVAQSEIETVLVSQYGFNNERLTCQYQFRPHCENVKFVEILDGDDVFWHMDIVQKKENKYTALIEFDVNYNDDTFDAAIAAQGIKLGEGGYIMQTQAETLQDAFGAFSNKLQQHYGYKDVQPNVTFTKRVLDNIYILEMVDGNGLNWVLEIV